LVYLSASETGSNLFPSGYLGSIPNPIISSSPTSKAPGIFEPSAYFTKK